VSAVSYVTGLWQRCVAAVRGATRTAPTQRADGDAGDPLLLVCAQALWMAATLAALSALALFSVQLYGLVSVIGLLCNRILFAPRERTARWWRVLNLLTWLCLAWLAAVVSRRAQLAMAAA